MEEELQKIINFGVTSFNGNDAVGLFKEDVLIDLIGYIFKKAMITLKILFFVEKQL